jgi:eukaryotic-like serine/threonine-protein kinase
MEEHAATQEGTPPTAEAVDGVKEALNRGTYLNRCQIGASSAVEVCAAIVNGEVLGVTVTIDPGRAAEADCVAGEVKQMTYPQSPSLIRAATTFEPSLGP